jgi:Na+/proline symporter
MGGIIMLAGYAAIMILLTVLATRKPRDVLEFHVADRNMGAVLSALSIAITWVDNKCG